MDNNYVIPLSLGIQSPPENGGMEPILCVSEVIEHPLLIWEYDYGSLWMVIYYRFNDDLLWFNGD